ncbi:hypothetical protein [Sphingomonas sp. CFBP 13720]|uniref:hypothetical protein n=1 Tax=Sphingomonas sp. CFBP 13720 TaxID=2775302 RepID=UPI0017811247|nr:hypothetical protein [Sphingomonas sp. CFBP 13720]MBD8679829.1 hypothetical protein [Sphingomonas sp. CFBP 13720]
MKYRSARTGKFLLDGAARIVAVPGMDRTWRSINAGSIVSDWTMVGNDLRRSMGRKAERIVG